MTDFCNTFWGSHGCDLAPGHEDFDIPQPFHECWSENDKTHAHCLEIKHPSDLIDLKGQRLGVVDGGWVVSLFSIDQPTGDPR